MRGALRVENGLSSLAMLVNELFECQLYGAMPWLASSVLPIADRRLLPAPWGTSPPPLAYASKERRLQAAHFDRNKVMRSGVHRL
jgi:hypothetical protein